MGKKDNIKTARKLVDAKRKREQDALREAGLTPSGLAVKKRIAQFGIETQINKGVKYSKLLEDFVSPMLSGYNEISSLETKYRVASHVWNAAIMRQRSEKEYQLAKEDLTSIMPEIGVLFDELAKRKEEKFSDYTNLIVDLEIKRNRAGNLDITVATTPFDSQKTFKRS